MRLGDLVARITSWFGIRPCNACERRRRWMNGDPPVESPPPAAPHSQIGGLR